MLQADARWSANNVRRTGSQGVAIEESELTMDPKTPAERKAEARDRLCRQLIDYSDESVEAIDAYASACIDEAVAPALASLDDVRATGGISNADHRRLRKLLTERAGT